MSDARHVPIVQGLSHPRGPSRDAPRSPVVTTADDLRNALCECGHRASGWHSSSGCQWSGPDPCLAWSRRARCPCAHTWPEALLSSGLLDRIRADAARDALTEAANDPMLRLAGHSGISVRGLRDRADLTFTYYDEAGRLRDWQGVALGGAS